MNTRHYPFWPKRQPYEIAIPVTNLSHNLAVSAQRYPQQPAIVFYDTALSYERVWREVEALAGYLQYQAGVRRGDRVLLFMQNSPQFVVAFHAIMRADAVVVPLNPMLVTDELAVYLADSGAAVALVGQELADKVLPLMPAPLRQVVVAAYGDYVERETQLSLPAAVAAPRAPLAGAGVVAWADALAAGQMPGPVTTGSEDPALLPYTSGTTGRPKGALHTHRSLQAVTTSVMTWFNGSSGVRRLSVLPYFHVTGMMCDMSAAVYAGATLVMLTRWESATALAVIERYGCQGLTAISTMVVDLLANPEFRPEKIASLRQLSGGGAPLPAAVGEQLSGRLGLTYTEGYGLTETISMTHSNPPERPKLQCLGVPTHGVDSRVIDPESGRELSPGETGEIVTSAAQVMREYWNQPEATAEAFIELDGKRFFRTGDLGYVDDEGYFFMVDRLKRMINVAGFKVWPAEVETQLFAHPAIKEACVIASVDPRRGEQAKALVVLRQGAELGAAELQGWARERMAAYKVPALVEFVESLPRGATGKVAWRELQEAEQRKTAAAV